MIREGSKVSYVGESAVRAVGDLGKVLSAAGDSSHVLWANGQITLESDADLVTTKRTAAEADHDVLGGSLVHIAVRDTFDASGPVGLLDALNEDGHLATFTAYAEDAMQAVAASIRTDPSMHEVLAHLESEEQAALINLATATLLRDAFGGEQ